MNPDGDRERPVLLAYDGSEHARTAIEEAGRLLSPGRSAVVLTAWQPLQTVPFFGGVAMPSVSEEVLREGEKEAQAVAREGAKLASAAGFDAEAVVEEGTPIWHRIVTAADEYDASVVVLGSHGRSGLSYAAMGSVATSVAHHIDRAVLITRAKGDGEPTR